VRDGRSRESRIRTFGVNSREPNGHQTPHQRRRSPAPPKGQMRDTQLTEALHDASKFVRSDSAYVARNATLARDDHRDYWTLT